MTCKRAGSRVVVFGGGLTFASLFGCGSGDVTILISADSTEPGGSPTLAVLAEPETLDAACRLIGVSSRNVAGSSASVAACQRVVEQCQSTVGVLGSADARGGAVGPDLGDGDLEELLGCPVTVIELDACVAQILERGRDSYASDVSCETTALPEIDPAFLLAVPACFGVVLRCPELLSLGEVFGAPG